MRCLLLLTSVALTTAISVSATSPHAHAQGQQAWGSIKGRVVWGGDKVPAPKQLAIPGAAAARLANHPKFNAANNMLLDDALLIHAKNLGIQNAFVFLIEKPGEPLPIHPNLKQVPKQMVVVDITNGTFQPRCAIVRQGQDVLFVNNSQWAYNPRWIGDGENNPGSNAFLQAGKNIQVQGLKAQRLPLLLEDNICGYVKGRVYVLNHPYAVLTDDHGNFEIRDAPAGKFALLIYHEELGYRVGKHGEPVTIPAKGVADLGVLPIAP